MGRLGVGGDGVGFGGVQVRGLGRSEELGGLGSKGLEEFGSRGRVGTGEVGGVGGLGSGRLG